MCPCKREASRGSSLVFRPARCHCGCPWMTLLRPQKIRINCIWQSGKNTSGMGKAWKGMERNDLVAETAGKDGRGLGGCFQLFHTQLRTHSGAGSPKAGCSLTGQDSMRCLRCTTFAHVQLNQPFVHTVCSLFTPRFHQFCFTKDPSTRHLHQHRPPGCCARPRCSSLGLKSFLRVFETQKNQRKKQQLSSKFSYSQNPQLPLNPTPPLARTFCDSCW